MPSFTLNPENIVVAVMSFDPVSPEQNHLDQYDTSIVGKLYENGAFYDVETQQADSAITTNDGSVLDE